ncbi:MAG: asparagine--tRNA ligase [Patescibacteria group bacterium]
MQTFIKDLAKFKDQEVTLKGWVYNFRSSGSLYFLQLRDGTGFAQIVVSQNGVDQKSWQNCEQITQETSIVVMGQVSQHPKMPDVYEIQAKSIEIISVAAEYPISNKEHGPEFLLDNRHLWLRSTKQWAIQQVRNTVINATYDFFAQNNFIKIDSPILTPNACEGTTTLFEVPYFDMGKAYLSQSGQLYIEAAIFAHGRVFDFGPVFRAEKSKTRRHLTEFWMMDAEMAFVEHEENMKTQEALISYIASQVVEKNVKELAILERDIEALKKIKAPFGRITYTDAIKKLQALGSDIKDGDDLGADDETLLTQDSVTPIFVEKWPKIIKAFYMKRDPENENFVLGSDMIAPEGHGEVIGGSQREDDYDILLARIEKEGLNRADFEWYLDLRKYGSVPHSGFGYGLERLVGWMCGIHHVRETIPFPRLVNRLRP